MIELVFIFLPLTTNKLILFRFGAETLEAFARSSNQSKHHKASTLTCKDGNGAENGSEHKALAFQRKTGLHTR